MDTTLAAAWKEWFRGGEPSGLWFGLSILWWGRLGKLLEFCAALTIVADIIGASNLRRFGNSLHGAFTREGARELIADARDWRLAMKRFIAARGEESDKALAETSKFIADKVNWIISFAIAIIAFVLLNRALSWWAAASLSFFVLAIACVSIGVWLTVALILTLGFLGTALDRLFVEPLAWILERDQLDRWVKLISLVLLGVGFHFDLLAS